MLQTEEGINGHDRCYIITHTGPLARFIHQVPLSGLMFFLVLSLSFFISLSFFLFLSFFQRSSFGFILLQN